MPNRRFDDTWGFRVVADEVESSITRAVQTLISLWSTIKSLSSLIQTCYPIHRIQIQLPHFKTISSVASVSLSPEIAVASRSQRSKNSPYSWPGSDTLPHWQSFSQPSLCSHVHVQHLPLISSFSGSIEAAKLANDETKARIVMTSKIMLADVATKLYGVLGWCIRVRLEMGGRQGGWVWWLEWIITEMLIVDPRWSCFLRYYLGCW